MMTRWRIGVILFLALVVPQLAYAGPFIDSLSRYEWDYALSRVRGDDILTTYAQWRRLRAPSSDASFEQIQRFVSRHPDWPDMNVIRMRAEKLLFVERRKAQSSEWLAQYPPLSGYGKLAAIRLHQVDAKKVKDAWINGDFDAPDERLILQEFGQHLDVTDHVARVERLLMEDKATIAERQLELVSTNYQKLFRARIALIRMDGGIEGKVNAVPSSLRQDHGYVADRAIWRDKKGLKSGALEMLQAMEPQSPYAMKLWPMRAWYVRDYIETRQYKRALSLLERAGDLDGAPNADALWLKGWISLVHQKEAGKAYEIFRELYDVVKYPVSRSRGAFWAAKAADKLGRKEEAAQWYKKAATYPTVFYGQLAQQKLNPGQPLQFPSSPAVPDALIDTYVRHELMQTAKKLTAIGEPTLADELITHLSETANDPAAAAALVKACAKAKLPLAQVRALKEAIKQNVLMVKEGWPVLNMKLALPIETPLAFAISRQESEFNPDAESSAGARGLMQILPSTGKRIAKMMGLGFDANRLFEPEYNVRIGSWYLGHLIDNFKGSYTMAIAGYNAGPARPLKWSREFGRPGENLEDTINWIETIPFAETRNYVQRVMENLQVYRAVMTPQQPLRLEQDLLR